MNNKNKFLRGSAEEIAYVHEPLLFLKFCRKFDRVSVLCQKFFSTSFFILFIEDGYR